MTREEVKDLLPILQAFAEGKQIQKLSSGFWVDVDSFYSNNTETYRIKLSPKYRPFAKQRSAGMKC